MVFDVGYEFKVDAKEGFLRIYSGSVVISEFHLVDGRVLSEAVDSIVVGIPDWSLSDKIKEWGEYIRFHFGLPFEPLSYHSWEIEKKAAGVDIRLRISGEKLYDRDWDAESGIMTIKKRPSMDISWSDYYWLYAEASRRLRALVEGF